MDDREAAAAQPAAAQTPPAAESAPESVDTAETSPDSQSPDPQSPDPQNTVGTRKRRSFLRELPFLIGTALVLALLLKVFVVQTFYIPSSSMEHTLHIDARVLLKKVEYILTNLSCGALV